jgi:hypothetical protein
MNRFFSSISQGFKRKPVVYIVVCAVVVWIFGKQLNKLLVWFRSRLQGSVISSSVKKKVAQDSGTSVDTVEKNVRVETCKGVASAVFAAMHEQYFGFLPRSWFGSKQDGDEIVKELNSLANGLEAKYASSYYFEKYQSRLKDEILTYSNKLINSFVSGYKDIRPEIWNNLN